MITRNQAIQTLLQKGVRPEVLAETYDLPVERITHLTKGRPSEAQARRKRIYDFIVAYMKAHCGLPPANREIGEAFSLSTSMVYLYLQDLAEQGLIAFHPDLYRSARNIYIPGATWTPPSL